MCDNQLVLPFCIFSFCVRLFPNNGSVKFEKTFLQDFLEKWFQFSLTSWFFLTDLCRKIMPVSQRPSVQDIPISQVVFVYKLCLPSITLNHPYIELHEADFTSGTRCPLLVESCIALYCTGKSQKVIGLILCECKETWKRENTVLVFLCNTFECLNKPVLCKKRAAIHR